MGFMETVDKILAFFEDPGPEPVVGDPITFEGKTYAPYNENKEKDPRTPWPNGLCELCRGVQLKPKMYYHAESDTYYHKECLEKAVAGKPAK